MCAKLLKSHRERSYSIRCARLGANILNFGMEMAMSNNHLNYLRREHARLDAEIQREERQVRPDEVLIARLKKLKLAVKDQMAAERSEEHTSELQSLMRNSYAVFCLKK